MHHLIDQLKSKNNICYIRALVPMIVLYVLLISRPDTKDRARSGKVIESTELRNDFHS